VALQHRLLHQALLEYWLLLQTQGWWVLILQKKEFPNYFLRPLKKLQQLQHRLQVLYPFVIEGPLSS
jgi:hypothetical protein